MSFALALLLAQSAVILENDYVRVTRDAAPCAQGTSAACGDRVIVALSDVEMRVGNSTRKLTRGDIAVFKPGDAHQQPTGGRYFEVAVKPNHPPVQSPRVHIAPDKNTILHDGERLMIFAEHLAVGDTRERHSHSQRVVIQFNRTRLQQWADGSPEQTRDIVPDTAAFNAPVVHRVKKVGDLPLRGVVIELKGPKQ
jgi:quercetin dioxygenase-like cupin family protein